MPNFRPGQSRFSLSGRLLPVFPPAAAGPAAPAITSSLAASGSRGVAFSYQIVATNTPTSYAATGLPAGLSIDTATGLISGTPSAGGTSNVSISATNAAGTGTATLVLTIAALAPVITSSLAASGSRGVAFSYQIVATNTPTSYAATGLPAGLSINTATGLISGTPSAGGTSNVSISATNAGGTDTKTLVLTIAALAPVITSGLAASGTANVAFSYQIVATNSPTSYAATGLPAGLSINTTTGLISGTPTTNGTTSVTISATNAGGTDTKTLSVIIAFAPSQLSPLAFWAVQPGYVFQDTAGTTPANTDGQSVALLKEFYGTSVADFQQATASKRPILRISGGLWWLDFDGVDDGMESANPLALPIENTIMFATGGATVSNNKVLLEYGPNADLSPGGFRISRGINRSHSVRNISAYYQDSSSSTWGAGTAVLGWRYTASGGVFEREDDGVAVAMAAATGTIQANTTLSQKLYLSGRTNTSLNPAVSFYGGGVLPRSVGFDARLRTWLGALQGRTL